MPHAAGPTFQSNVAWGSTDVNLQSFRLQMKSLAFEKASADLRDWSTTANGWIGLRPKSGNSIDRPNRRLQRRRSAPQAIPLGMRNGAIGTGFPANTREVLF